MSVEPPLPIAAQAQADVAAAINDPANVTILFDRPITLRIVCPDLKLEVVDPHTMH